MWDVKPVPKCASDDVRCKSGVVCAFDDIHTDNARAHRTHDNNTIDNNILDVFKKFTDDRTCTDSKKISLEKNTNDTASSFDDLSKLYGTSSFDIYSSIDYTTVGFNKKQNDALDDFSDIYLIDFDMKCYYLILLLTLYHYCKLFFFDSFFLV